MLTFIGIVLLSDYHSLPSEEHYWNTDEDLSVPCVSQHMSRNQFQQIKHFFHLEDNTTLRADDKLAKLRSYLDFKRIYYNLESLKNIYH